ncbi:hypothetical protein [Pontibacillus sp. HMF3514]|nr:hypothetical protein [Pontibacillus sp. HMF3514]
MMHIIIKCFIMIVFAGIGTYLNLNSDYMNPIYTTQDPDIGGMG